jgi:hypothetical protein
VILEEESGEPGEPVADSEAAAFARQTQRCHTDSTSTSVA